MRRRPQAGPSSSAKRCGRTPGSRPPACPAQSCLGGIEARNSFARPLAAAASGASLPRRGPAQRRRAAAMWARDEVAQAALRPRTRTAAQRRDAPCRAAHQLARGRRRRCQAAHGGGAPAACRRPPRAASMPSSPLPSRARGIGQLQRARPGAARPAHAEPAQRVLEQRHERHRLELRAAASTTSSRNAPRRSWRRPAGRVLDVQLPGRRAARPPGAPAPGPA